MAFFPKTPIIQYFLTAKPPPPFSHTQHTISKICFDINKKGRFSNGIEAVWCGPDLSDGPNQVIRSANLIRSESLIQ